MTIDSIPYIGYYSFSKTGWYVASGFKKWGMSSSMASALFDLQIILLKRRMPLPMFFHLRASSEASAKRWQRGDGDCQELCAGENEDSG